MAALRAIAERLLDQAEQGDMAALKELGDRVEGRPTQLIAGDEEAGPIRHEFVWKSDAP
jgi:phage gp29-like protein